MCLLSKVLQFAQVKVQVQDRMIQPTVDVNCSSVLWGNLHAPKDVAKVLEKLVRVHFDVPTRMCIASFRG